MCLDEALLQGIGAAHQFADAEFPLNTPPKGFMTFLKTGLGAHLKAHGYHYRQMLDDELAKIKVSLQRWPAGTQESSRLDIVRLRLTHDCCAVLFLATTAAEGAAGTCICTDWISAGGSPHRLCQLHRPRALQEFLRGRIESTARFTPPDESNPTLR